MAGVFVAKPKDGAVRVGVTGARRRRVPFERDGAGATGAWNADAVQGVDIAADGMMLSDIHGSAAYRANLVKVMAKRAVAAAG